MKILVTTGIFPPDIGGPASYVPRLVSALVQQGHAVRVVTLADVPRSSVESMNGVAITRIRRRCPKLFRVPLAVVHIARELRWADLVYGNGLMFETTLAVALAARPMIQKIVGDFAWERAVDRGWTQDDFDTFQKRRQTPKVELLRAARKACVARASKVIVPSRYLMTCVVAWGIPENRVAVIPNAACATERLEPETVDLGAHRRVVTVGRLMPWKRTDLVLEAVKRLEDVGLLVIGDGPERQRLESLSREFGLQDRVHFTGSVPNQRALNMMRACHVFVLNSTYEGCPHVILEARALGLPVVSSNAVGSVEALAGYSACRIVSGADPGELAQAIIDLLPRASPPVTNPEPIGDGTAFQRMIAETLEVLADSLRGEVA